MTRTDPYEPELAAAREIALAAWRGVEKYYGADVEVTHKKDGPATIADREASRFILAELAARFPGDGLLSEEDPDDFSRLERERVWIVDPIDGTKGFISGSGDFAVQLGLAVRRDGEYHSILGVVYHPVRDCLYFAREGAGAWAEERAGAGGGEAPRRLAVTEELAIERMRAVVTRSHRTPLFLKLLERLRPRRTLTMGSLGLKVVWVAAGKADYYFNNARGMCSEWDVCAPDVILREAGGALTDLEGKAIRYNRREVRVTGGVLASNSGCHEELRLRILELEREVKAEAKAEASRGTPEKSGT